MKTNIFDLTYQELEAALKGWGEPGYRARQVWNGLYAQLWEDPEDFTPLPLPLRERLAQEFVLTPLTVARIQESTDGETRKYLNRLGDGAAIETVLMSYRDRNTVCISSQVGCAMGCEFCATGSLGFTRNLSSGEIIAQVIQAAALLAKSGESLTNIVFMGMGEPFHNYRPVMKAVEILNDPGGFKFGARRITISTVGLVPGIRRFAEEDSQVNLAISLHAADDSLRSSLMPVNKKYPLADLMAACRYYLDRTRRRISIEWALIAGVNDTPEQAHKLAGLIKDGLYHVNLIRLNPVQHYPGRPSETDRAAEFQAVLASAGISATFRVRRGIDIQAGCGQLASQA